MTKEEAKKWLNKLYSRADITDEYGDMEDMQPYEEAVNMAIQFLEQTRWIPVSERLPEEDGQYLITVKYVHVDGYDDIYAEHGEWMGGKWDTFCFGHCGQVETILAWMPLPEPYKAESEEGI